LVNYEKALAIAARQFARHSDDRDARRELSWTLKKIGDNKMSIGDVRTKAGDTTSAKSLYTAALDGLEDALCVRKKVSADEPEKTEYLRDVLFVLQSIAKVKDRLEDAPGGEAALFEGYLLSEDIARQVRDDPRYRADAANSAQLLSDILARRDLQAALAYLETAMQIRDLLARQGYPTETSAIGMRDDLKRKIEAIHLDLRGRGFDPAKFDDNWRFRMMATVERKNRGGGSFSASGPEDCWIHVQDSARTMVAAEATTVAP
jgi:hypothetical protein